MRELKPKGTTTLPASEESLGWQPQTERGESQVSSLLWYYGGLVRERRHELKMTQQELAGKVGMKTGLISRIEKGEADIMFSSFIRVMNALNLQIDIQY
ncbi:MAG: helix-turn-helix transcriptional regulator [Alistipes sp.]